MPRITEQEQKLEELFSELTQGFKDLDKLKNVQKQEALLKELTDKIKDGKALIKEFEREARNDLMPADELARRKTALVNELNNFISIKKTQTQILNTRTELMPDRSPDEGQSRSPTARQTMTTQQIVSTGRKEMKQVENTLGRAEKVVQDTIEIGTQTAAELRDQTKQLERVADDLDDIEFTLKKARKALGDLTRGLLTDKMIRLLLLLVLIAVAVVIVLSIFRDNDSDGSLPKPQEIGGTQRKLLRTFR